MRRSLVWSLAAVLVVAFGSLAATIAAGNSPELGLDLQGGASVVLEPPSGVDDGDVLDQAIQVIRNRVDALGVAEPVISRQGDAIVVELPGVSDQQRALDIVGQTAELRFRPVLGVLPPEDASTTTTTSAEDASTTTTTSGEGEGGSTTTSTAEDADGATTTTAPSIDEPTTEREEDDPDEEVVLSSSGDGGPVERYRLGPAALRGSAVADAQARNPSGFEWVVEVEFTGDGSDEFNQIAATCFNAQPECPTGRLAIVLDSEVQSAPTIQEPQFQGSAVISGSFTEGEAKDLALVLRYGALPVQLEQQTVRTVSASLGQDSLRAGLIAGAIGTGLVLLYLLVYYRALGLVVLLGLTVWFSLQWSVISYLGVSQGLALSLAGVTGIVVSVGVTVDSYIVYFERLKDEIRSGRTVRSSVERGFRRAFRTILAADTSAFIGAALLYLLTVGPVRGFAFFLGLSTLLDVLVAWFFTRPLVALLARRRAFSSGRLIGVTAPAATATPSAAGSTA